MAFCREEMTSCKMPGIVHYIEMLLKSAVGKFLRREWRDGA